ncbi:MAG: hypothetical protein R2779_04900 [Crocinitomicaceae bacterium]
MKYQVNQPSYGHDLLIQPTFNNLLNRWRYMHTFSPTLASKNSRNSDGTIIGIEDVYQRNYRLNVTYKVSEDFTLKSRVEYVTINRPNNKPEDGILFTQDVVYNPKKLPFEIALRYAMFDTDSYDSRIYSFEANALYVYSIPAYCARKSRLLVV